MDKNMIHIDDLVKKRLSGGEEQEMPGSWLRMRELLDKEMPEKKRVAGYYNWRRMFGVMTGLALLSVLTVGGYNVISTRFKSSNEYVAKALPESGKLFSAESRSSGLSASAPSGKPLTDKAAASLTKAATEKKFEASQIHTADKHAERGADLGPGVARSGDVHSSENSTPPAKKVKPMLAAGVSEGGNSRSEHEVVANLTPLTQGKMPANVAATQPRKRQNPVQNQPNVAEAARTPASATADMNQPVAPKSNADIAHTTQPIQNFNSANTVDNAKVKLPAPLQPDRLKDSMNKITIVQRLTVNPLTRVGRLVADTISLERFALNASELSVVKTEGTAANEPASAINPAAATTSAAAADAALGSGLVPLSNYKVQSRKTSKWNARTFDEVVRDVKFNLAQVNFYPGISVGGNSYVFGPNNIGGIQLGLFGLFTFGETWSAMGELKYIHRFNGGSTLKDNYVDLRPTSSGFLQGNVEHFFKFTTLQSIEMPLALRYAAGRLNVFGGINLAYHFGVNAEEVTLHAPDTAYVPLISPNGKVKASPSVSYHDFRARFALGGLAGISFQVTPSIQLDMRATKNFWDNGYGLGAEQVSQQYYNNTSMQFSIFYRFSQKNQIPRAR